MFSNVMSAFFDRSGTVKFGVVQLMGVHPRTRWFEFCEGGAALNNYVSYGIVCHNHFQNTSLVAKAGEK